MLAVFIGGKEYDFTGCWWAMPPEKCPAGCSHHRQSWVCIVGEDGSCAMDLGPVDRVVDCSCETWIDCPHRVPEQVPDPRERFAERLQALGKKAMVNNHGKL